MITVDHIIVMGVSGVGKTTIGIGIASAMGWEFADGDAFHSEANVAKMASGHPLTDEDRWPWLTATGAWITEHQERGESAVVACSALRRVYRDRLRDGRPGVRFCHLVTDSGDVRHRLDGRTGHYMPPALLPSQVATLEPLAPDEPGVVVSAGPDAAATVVAALARLELVPRGNAAAAIPGSPPS